MCITADPYALAGHAIYGEQFREGNPLLTRYWVKHAHQTEMQWVDVQDLIEEGEG